MELTFQKDKLKQMREENSILNGEVTLLKGKLNKQSSDADDILTHKQREISQKVERVNGLEARVKELEAVNRERDEQIKALEQERKESQKKLDQAAQLAAEKAMLEEAVRRQDAVIERQDEEMERLKNLQQELEEAMAKTRLENEDLFLKASGTTNIAILFGEPWLLTRSFHRLKGDVPLDREENSLTNLGGKHLVLYGGGGGGGRGGAGGSGNGGDTGGELGVVNLDNFHWEKPSNQRKGGGSGWRSGHTGTGIAKNKLVTFGGRWGNAMTNEVQIFNTDSLKWITPAVKGACDHREYHASCALREKVYVMGGVSEEGDLTSDLWLLDFDTMQWSVVSTYGQAAPRPRRGHAMCGSEEDRKIIVCGGFDGDTHLMDVCILETDRLTWSCPSTTGMMPPPREGHAASMVGKYLFIAGGCDGHRQLADVYALDTESMIWECITDGTDGGGLGGMSAGMGAMGVGGDPTSGAGAMTSSNGMGNGMHGGGSAEDSMAQMMGGMGMGMAGLGLKPRSRYYEFHGRRLYMLKPDRDERLSELEVLDFALPDDIEGMIEARKRGDDQASARLELLDVANTSPNSIEVSWRPPGKNADRVHHYKLMMATNTGVVKEVCQGKYERFKVTGLRANAEYIFCVKAIYDDGKHVWSESKAFCTRYGGGNGGAAAAVTTGASSGRL